MKYTFDDSDMHLTTEELKQPLKPVEAQSPVERIKRKLKKMKRRDLTNKSK